MKRKIIWGSSLFLVCYVAFCFTPFGQKFLLSFGVTILNGVRILLN